MTRKYGVSEGESPGFLRTLLVPGVNTKGTGTGSRTRDTVLGVSAGHSTPDRPTDE